MIAGALAFVVALAAEERNPRLDIDACVEVDEAAVQKLVELELRDAGARKGNVPIAVAVGCIEDGQEIRVEPWASRGDEGVRTIGLPPGDAADPAAQEARSRELALAIAELIRRLEITRPLSPPPSPPPPPPAPPTAAFVVPPPRPPEAPPGKWQLALLSSFEYFTGGQKLAGGDVSAAAPIGRWILGELRMGGRFAEGVPLPGARLTARAGTAAAALGLNLWSRRRSIGFALMLRGQGFVVDYQVAPGNGGGSRMALLGAFVVAVEPRLLVAVTRRISVEAAAGAGVPVHGVVVRSQGADAQSLSGLAISTSIGAVLAL